MQKTLLAIEDDPQIAELLRVLLSSTELKVVHYADGTDGLSAVLEQRPDMVLLDIMVPGMNGWEVYDKIRANEHVKDTPIIVVTVTAQQFERRAAFHASQIDFHITKPFDILALRKKIKELLDITEWRVGDKFPERKTTPVKVRTVTDRLREIALQEPRRDATKPLGMKPDAPPAPQVKKDATKPLSMKPDAPPVPQVKKDVAKQNGAKSDAPPEPQVKKDVAKQNGAKPDAPPEPQVKNDVAKKNGSKPDSLAKQ